MLLQPSRIPCYTDEHHGMYSQYQYSAGFAFALDSDLSNNEGFSYSNCLANWCLQDICVIYPPFLCESKTLFVTSCE